MRNSIIKSSLASLGLLISAQSSVLAQDALDTVDFVNGLPLNNFFEDPQPVDDPSAFSVGQTSHNIMANYQSSFFYDTNITGTSAEVEGFTFANKLSIGTLFDFKESKIEVRPSLSLSDVRHDHLSSLLDQNTVGFNLNAKRTIFEGKKRSLSANFNISSIWVYSSTFDSQLARLVPLTASLVHSKSLWGGNLGSNLSVTRVISNPDRLDSWEGGLNTVFTKDIKKKMKASVGFSVKYKAFDQYGSSTDPERRGWVYGATANITHGLGKGNLVVGANILKSDNALGNFDYEKFNVGPTVSFNMKW